MSKEALTVKQYKAVMDGLQLLPTPLAVGTVITGLMLKDGRADASLAPIVVNTLRHSYTKVYEIKYPEYAAANGDVLPIDNAPNPADTHWEYDVVDVVGYATWVGDDGHVMPTGGMTMRKERGQMHEMAFRYDLNFFDLERAAKAGVQLKQTHQKNVAKVHAAKTNWTWLFGDSSKQLPGLFTHPNIQVTLAPLSAAATFGDNRDRLIESKTVDEILADVEDMVERTPKSTIRAHYTMKVYMPYTDIAHMKRRRLGTTGDSTPLTIWKFIQDNYGTAMGDVPAVEFLTLNECDPAYRRHPETGTDDSNITGRTWISIPVASADELSFIRARPIVNRAPEPHGFMLRHDTHSKVGGCKCQIPLAVHRKDFLAADQSTPAP